MKALSHRKLALLVATVTVLAAGPVTTTGAAGLSAAELNARLNGQMALAGPYSGAYVADLTTGQQLFSWSSTTRRIPASVEKLYTTATALIRYGPEHQFETRLLGTGTLDGEDGTYSGNLYLEGGGDPTFGTRRFNRRSYGVGADVEQLAEQFGQGGASSVHGRLLRDESVFDGVRGVPDSGWAISPYVGPLSGLAFNRGSAKSASSALIDALEAEGLRVKLRTDRGESPTSAQELAKVTSPPLRKIAALTNRPSDNFIAETLLKDIGASFGGQGSTTVGAQAVRAQLAQFGVRPTVVDGSGLARANRTSPRQVVRLLERMTTEPSYDAFYDSLPVIGRQGTVRKRMRRTAAQDSCRAKTGTLRDVSSLAGYCTTANGSRIAFAFLMNGVNTYSARKLQDRMTVALARYGG